MKNSLTLPIDICPMEPGASEAGLILQRSIESNRNQPTGVLLNRELRTISFFKLNYKLFIYCQFHCDASTNYTLSSFILNNGSS